MTPKIRSDEVAGLTERRQPDLANGLFAGIGHVAELLACAAVVWGTPPGSVADGQHAADR